MIGTPFDGCASGVDADEAGIAVFIAAPLRADALLGTAGKAKRHQSSPEPAHASRRPASRPAHL
jgi:hypothetical protein